VATWRRLRRQGRGPLLAAAAAAAADAAARIRRRRRCRMMMMMMMMGFVRGSILVVAPPGDYRAEHVTDSV